METYKTGDKVLLYSLKECKLKPWYKKYNHQAFAIFTYYGFKYMFINDITKDMIYRLGTICLIYNCNNKEFNIKGFEPSWYTWPVQLIKEKIS